MIMVDSKDAPLWTEPLHKLLLDQYKGKRLVVGVAIVSKSNKLLLVQRAADEDAFPNMYELPGGHCEPDKLGDQPPDETILDTVIRETFEETGLAVKQIVKELTGFEYDTDKGPTQQFNFIIDLEEVSPPLKAELPTLKLNPKEHQAYAWVGPEDSLDQFPMSKDMKVVVQSALAAIAAPPAKAAEPE
ncbi:NUDIX hydrolase domain-like protein [Mycena vitilis]|nr:NUDIX hydrolase domain-like protein [Mycena vitilis]